ncbi:large ribosomal subunit protein eL33-like [Sycon ciliatum]|uniref:Large ribosomal subunit protein eL33 n=1 Tax=Sycon ciliatum TaxID=27933 RepID=M1XMP2_9METZ|nr:60S ribosomal protein L35A/L37 [Sycon ciliatum]|eukprot:scpid29861/ scgid15006/ 60S ribosomal protein L35a; Cell growth-inhibiting gene 33 protein &gt; 60S ribosomal protein L35a &gt; 60S ribosomal protein L35a
MSSHAVKLYSKGVVLGYKRGLRNQHENTSLIRVQGVNEKKDTDFYMGKRVAYVYRASHKKPAVMKRARKANKVRVIWGKVTRSHGNSGVVRVQFRKNLPGQAIGASVRVMLYPSRV